MVVLRFGKLAALLSILLLAVNLPVRADDGRFDGTVIFLRHALAPGNGDPANFNLKDYPMAEFAVSKGVRKWLVLT